MKKVYISLAFIVALIFVIIFAIKYSVELYGTGGNNTESLSEDDIVWADKFGTKEAQYKAAGKRFEENSQYFIEMQKYYATIDFQCILENQISKLDEVEIEGVWYLVDVNDDSVKMYKKSNSDEVPYGNAEDEIAKYVGHCQQICISIDKETGELEQILIDVTNKNEPEMVYLIWSKEKLTYAYGISELSVENWVSFFYGGI